MNERPRAYVMDRLLDIERPPYPMLATALDVGRLISALNGLELIPLGHDLRPLAERIAQRYEGPVPPPPDLDLIDVAGDTNP